MKYEIRKMSQFRLLSINSYEVIGSGHNMYAQIEIDVTDVRKRLRSQRQNGRKVSFYGFLLSAIAKTIDDNKELNHIRCGNKIYFFDEVDIDTVIELNLDGNPVPRKYIVRDAARKSMDEITLEIENAKKCWKESGIAGEDDKWALRWIKLTTIMPKWIYKIIVRHFERKPFKIKQRFGTTYVTSVSGFTDVSGFILPYIEGKNRPLAFAIGSLVKKPGIINSEITTREFLSMTVQINHDLVDGAPAARFINQLKHKIEDNFIPPKWT